MEICKTCSFDLKDNEIDVFISQVKAEIKKLADDTTARLLLQDGKIAETCVYIKNNLSNELRTMLDTLKSNGELNDIITNTIMSEIDFVKNGIYPLGHIKNHKAKGDGIANDTLAIKSAVKEALLNNKALIIDEGTYLINENINATGIKEIIIKGEITTKNNSVLEIGSKSTDGTGIKANIKKIKNLKITGCKNSIFDIGSCERLHLYADGDKADIASLAYCQFYGSYAKEVILESVGINIGWINENVFRIKRIEEISFKGSYLHNNNIFEHCNLEKGVVNFNGARNNRISARCEGGITINTDSTSESNFIEKEYYYKHYFGDPVINDESNNITYSFINKLQSEEMLYKLDKNNKNYPAGTLLFNEEGLFKGKNFNEIYHSNLIKIDSSFALILKSSTNNFRVKLNFYDENRNRIVTEVDNFADGKMSYLGELSDFSYQINSNVSEDIINFYKGRAKYVEYVVMFGNNENAEIEYLDVKLLKLTNTNIHITNTLKNRVYTSVPTEGYFERGEILLAKNPVAGASIGIICVEAGSPGVWKNFAEVSE